MARLINADALIEQIRLMANRTSLGETAPSDLSGLEVCGLIFRAPTVDAVPVAHGRWVDNGIPESVLSGCSVCGFPCGAYTFNYCPNCGAKMDLEVP